MRKLAAILLLAIFTFNFYGYRIYIALLEKHAEISAAADISDNNYEESELVSIKLPAPHLFYNLGSTEFTVMHGHIEADGVDYNYVKRRLINDSVEFLCLPNKQLARLKTAKDEFFRLVNNLQDTRKKSKNNSTETAFKLLTQKYFPVSETVSVFNYPTIEVLQSISPYSLHFSAGCISTIGKPPEMS